MRWLASSLAIGFVLFFPISGVRADETLVCLPTRTEVTQSFLLEVPDQAKAAVLLFAGSAGHLGLESVDGRPRIANGNNFLVRSRHLFAQAGLIVATLDAPSDQSGGMDAAFRLSPEHAEDVAAVVAYLRKQASLPVWLVGTSQGTLSVARVGAQLGHQIDGVALTSSISRSGGRQSYHGAVAPQGVLTLGLEGLAVPVLVLAHADDACGVTPADDASRIIDHLEQSPRKSLRVLHGGDPPRSGPCDALSAHGYLGIEPEAVQAIADFVLGR